MNRLLYVLLSTMLLIPSAPLFGQEVMGVASLTLSAPATDEQKVAVEQAATDSLRNTLYQWVSHNLGRTPNISNPLERHFFNLFTKGSLSKAHRKSLVEGHDFVISYTLNAEQIQQAIDEHNALYDRNAIQAWTLCNENLKRKNYPQAFISGIHAIYNAIAHIGDPLKQPEDTSNVLFVSAQRTVQDMLKKLSITVNEPVVKGKPSEPILNPVALTAIIDSMPLAGLPLICRLPSGKELLTTTTDAQGVATMARLKMPFVAYGTFLHVQPNFGAIIDPGLFFTGADMGLTLLEGHDQTLIFNLVKPVYTLEYEVAGANTVQIPKDFQENAKFHQFLRDSLHMQQSTGQNVADIAISIRCQVTSYTSDETEHTRMKTEMIGSVRQLKVNGTRIEETVILNEKEYPHSHDIPTKAFNRKKKEEGTESKIPTGDYFWETMHTLRVQIRSMLNKL